MVVSLGYAPALVLFVAGAVALQRGQRGQRGQPNVFLKPELSSSPAPDCSLITG